MSAVVFVTKKEEIRGDELLESILLENARYERLKWSDSWSLRCWGRQSN